MLKNIISIIRKIAQRKTLISREEAIELNNMVERAQQLMMSNQLSDAIGLFEQALKRSESLENGYGQMVSLTGLGQNYRKLKEDNKALSYFQKALPLAKRIDKQGQFLGILYDGIGQIYREQGDYTSAIEHIEFSVKIRRESGNEKGVVHGLLQLGFTFFEMEQWKEAQHHFQDCIKLAVRLNDKRLTAEIYGTMSLAYGQKKKFRKAIEMAKQALEWEEKHGHPIGVLRAYELLASHYEESGDLEQSARYQEKALKILKSMPGGSMEVVQKQELLKGLYNQLGIDLKAKDFSESNHFSDSLEYSAEGWKYIKPAASRDYGYSKHNAIKVGGGITNGAENERKYLEYLRGPDGQVIHYTRRGSTSVGIPDPPEKDAIESTSQKPYEGNIRIVDIYEIRYEGLQDPIVLYLDMYDFEELRIPFGFTIQASLEAKISQMISLHQAKEYEQAARMAEEVEVLIHQKFEKDASQKIIALNLLVNIFLRAGNYLNTKEILYKILNLQLALLAPQNELIIKTKERISIIEKLLSAENPAVQNLDGMLSGIFIQINPEELGWMDGVISRNNQQEIFKSIVSSASEDPIIHIHDSPYPNDVRIVSNQTQNQVERVSEYFGSPPDENQAKQGLELIPQFSLSQKTANSLDVSLHYNRLVSGGGSVLKILDLKTGFLIRRIFLQRTILAVKLLQDDTKVLSVDDGEFPIKKWDLATGKCLAIFSFRGRPLTQVKFSLDEKWALAVEEEKYLVLWHLEEGTVERLFWIAGQAIDSIDISADNRYALSYGKDRCIRIWHIPSGRHKQTARLDQEVRDVRFSNRIDHVIAIDEKGQLSEWNLEERIQRIFWEGSLVDAYVGSYQLSQDKQFALTFHRDKKLRYWQIETGNLISVTPENRNRNQPLLCLSPNNSSWFEAEGDSIKEWALPSNELIRDFGKNTIALRSFRFLRNNQALAMGTSGINLWDLETLALISYFPGKVSYSYAISPSEEMALLALHQDDQNKVVLVDFKTKQVLREFGPRIVVDHMAFSPDQQQAVFYHRLKQELPLEWWRLDGELIEAFSIPFMVKKLFFLDRENTLLLVGENLVQENFIQVGCFDLTSGSFTQKHEFDCHALNDAQLSKDQRFLIVAVGDSIRLWDWENGTEQKIIEAHQITVRSIAVFPDNNRFLSVGDDHTIKYWDLNTGDLLWTYPGHQDWINSIDISFDGTYFATTSSDGTTKIWQLDTGRYLTLIVYKQEWFVYTPDGFFDASQGGGELACAVQGLRAFQVDQLAVFRNRPDLILKNMGFGNLEIHTHFEAQYRRRQSSMQQSNLVEPQNYFEAPSVEITKTQLDPDGATAEIHFSISGYQVPASHYRLYNNGVLLFEKEVGTKLDIRASYSEKVPLLSGINKIEVEGINVNGITSMRDVHLIESQRISLPGDLYFIGFGVSIHANASFNLNFAHKDVLDLAKIFKMGEYFSNVHTYTFVNEEATVANLLSTSKILQNTQPNDTVIFMISGHGTFSDDENADYFFVTHEFDKQDIQHTSASLESIQHLLEQSKSIKKLLLIDTCFSGERYEQEEAAPTGFMHHDLKFVSRASRDTGFMGENKVAPRWKYFRERYIYNDLSRRSGAVIFSSCLGLEPSCESFEIENGAFTYAIKKVLTSNEPEIKSISFLDLKRRVSELVQEFTNNRQHPTVDYGNIEQKIVLPVYYEHFDFA